MDFNYSEVWRIFAKSFKQAFKWKVWKWLLGTSLGSVIGSIQTGEKLFHLEWKTSLYYGVGTVIALFLFRFSLQFAKESLKYWHEVYKNSVYGDALVLLKDSFALTHAYRKTPGHRDKEFMFVMITFCDNLKTIFDKIIKDDCSVSIKVSFSDSSVQENTVLMNLTRDVQHSGRDTKKYMETKHTLIGNTAFISVFNKVIKNSKDKYYLNNSVNNTTNYDSTSKECHDSGILPYNSELVFPIVPIVSGPSSHFDCLGFICVDAKKPNAFSSKYEISILEGVADGIYDLISERILFKRSLNSSDHA